MNPRPDHRSPAPRVVGVDVGGPRKGFHAVAMEGLDIVADWRGADAHALAAWCAEHGAAVVAVDAPCRWRGPGLARASERALAAEGIACYYAPTEQQARGNAFYTWMLPGAALYHALAARFPLYDGGAVAGPVAIETFPQAVACALAGRIVSAKAAEKRLVRRELLQRAGVKLRGDESTDELDARLCALAGLALLRGEFKAYGDAKDGFIVVPARALPAPRVEPPEPVVYTPLKHHLQDWADIDVAQFHLARCLGIFDTQTRNAKATLWSDNPTGNLLHQLLLSLEKAGVVEIDHEELKVRWRRGS